MKTDTSTSQAAITQLMAEECLAVRVRLLNRTITSVYDEALRPLGMTTAQLNILVVVANRGPISPGDVARRLNMEKSTLSRNIDRMREHGWVNIDQSTSGRGLLLEVSMKGRKLLKRSLPLWKQAQARATAVLGERGAQGIHRAANAVWTQAGRN